MSRYDFTPVLEWDRIPGWFELPKAIALQQTIKLLPAGAAVVELGSFCGRSSVALAAVLPPGGLLYCVDHFQGSAEHQDMGLNLHHLRQAFTQTVEAFGVRDKVRVLAMDTTAAAQHFADQTIDLLLVDASHDYDSVLADLRHWYPKLKPGAWLFCDDYAPQWPGVVQAIQAAGLQGTVVTVTLWQHRKPVEFPPSLAGTQTVIISGSDPPP